MKHILVTGANGYIGRHVVSALLNKGCQVTACDLNLNDVDKRAKHIQFDLFTQTQENLYEQLGCPDVCLHMAWRDGFIHHSDKHMLDLSSHYSLLTNLIKHGLKQLAVMGTMHEVGYWEGKIDENTPCNPISMYGISKDALRRSMIQYCNNNQCKLQWLRAYYILGDDLKNHSIFCKLIQSTKEGKKKFPFTSGKTKYDFIHINDLADQISDIVMQSEILGIINCCSGNPVTLGEKVESFIKEHNLDIQLEYGAFPDRAYDSPIIYGDTTKIDLIQCKQK